MALYVAVPYDRNVSPFQFTTFENYEAQQQASGAEEFEIQFLEGTDEEEELFNAARVNQANLATWLDIVDRLSDLDKAKLFHLCRDQRYELSYSSLRVLEGLEVFEGSLLEFVQQQFDEKYPDLPEEVSRYIDYQKMAQDKLLSGQAVEFDFAGRTFVALE